MMQQYQSNSYLFGGNAPYVEELYEAYLDNPGSVPDNWRAYFDALQNVPAVDGSESRDIAHAPVIESFAQRACAIDVRPAYGGRKPPARAGVRFFFPRPSTGSGCKRLNLFLRWMVRRDQVDPGGWQRVTPAQLIVPLDTHVVRVGRCLRLTSYQSPGWRMASDITRTLRELDPIDPVKYDFSICHLGMMNACGFGRRQGDSQCPLKGLCRPRSSRRS